MKFGITYIVIILSEAKNSLANASLTPISTFNSRILSAFPPKNGVLPRYPHEDDTLKCCAKRCRLKCEKFGFQLNRQQRKCSLDCMYDCSNPRINPH